MRIVAGAFKGKALVSPDGATTRPTSDRARQALFNVLEHASWADGLAGARVLDLFAGTGALGLEALSRGAAHATFVERDPAALAALRANVAGCRVEGRAIIRKADASATSTLATLSGPFDLVFLDPPYRKGLIEASLAALPPAALSPAALVVAETARDEAFAAPERFALLDRRVWGAAAVHVLRWTGQGVSGQGVSGQGVSSNPAGQPDPDP
jgi:16S rRNA (guanine966-N2)-methyltransferase